MWRTARMTCTLFRRIPTVRILMVSFQNDNHFICFPVFIKFFHLMTETLLTLSHSDVVLKSGNRLESDSFLKIFCNSVLDSNLSHHEIWTQICMTQAQIELWSVTCRMASHSVTCHPTQVNMLCLSPSQIG